jgi:multidrug efflux system outer membrane protein
MKSLTTHRVPLAALVLAVLSACTLGPNYQRPDQGLPSSYDANIAQSAGAAVVDAQWWTLFGDATLNTLVASAFEKNADLRLAVARIDEAAGVLSETGAALLPEIDLAENSSRSRASTLSAIPVPASAVLSNSHRLALSTSFELDLWGKLRRATESARAQLLASQYGRDSTRLTLAGTVAQSYFALRSLDAQIIATSASLKSREASASLAGKRLAGGVASALDVNQAEAARADAASTLKDLVRQRAAIEHQLGSLTGQPGLVVAPGDLAALPVPAAPPAGLPATLLERRPDVAQAEQTLVAANAQIGYAKAAMLPTISLTGNLGGQSAELSDILKSGARIWSAGIGLSFPLIDGGKFKARTEQAEARQRQAVASYQKAVETAFRETADGLVAVQQSTAQEADLKARADAAAQSLKLAQRRYEAGYSGFLEVLDAQRTANDAQNALVRGRQARLAYTVDLMKALGGGWSPGR